MVMKVQKITFLLLTAAIAEVVVNAAPVVTQNQSVGRQIPVEQNVVSTQATDVGQNKESQQPSLAYDELVKAYNELKRVNESLQKDLQAAKEQIAKVYEMHKADHKCKKYKDQQACKQSEQLRKEIELSHKA
jgi:hypothetical protein